VSSAQTRREKGKRIQPGMPIVKVLWWPFDRSERRDHVSGRHHHSARPSTAGERDPKLRRRYWGCQRRVGSDCQPTPPPQGRGTRTREERRFQCKSPGHPPKIEGKLPVPPVTPATSHHYREGENAYDFIIMSSISSRSG